VLAVATINATVLTIVSAAGALEFRGFKEILDGPLDRFDDGDDADTEWAIVQQLAAQAAVIASPAMRQAVDKLGRAQNGIVDMLQAGRPVPAEFDAARLEADGLLEEVERLMGEELQTLPS
jgi:hypothetical protein